MPFFPPSPTTSHSLCHCQRTHLSPSSTLLLTTPSGHKFPHPGPWAAALSFTDYRAHTHAFCCTHAQNRWQVVDENERRLRCLRAEISAHICYCGQRVLGSRKGWLPMDPERGRKCMESHSAEVCVVRGAVDGMWLRRGAKSLRNRREEIMRGRTAVGELWAEKRLTAEEQLRVMLKGVKPVNWAHSMDGAAGEGVVQDQLAEEMRRLSLGPKKEEMRLSLRPKKEEGGCKREEEQAEGQMEGQEVCSGHAACVEEGRAMKKEVMPETPRLPPKVMGDVSLKKDEADAELVEWEMVEADRKEVSWVVVGTFETVMV